MIRRFVLLLLCCAASKASFGHTLSFSAFNVGKVHLECGYMFAEMASGVPDVPPPGEIFNAGQAKVLSVSFTSVRMAIRFAVYKDGLLMDTRSAWARNASFNAPPIFYAFTGDSTNGTLQIWDNEPRPSAPPSNSVPVGWPNGRATPGNGLKQIPNLGSYVWDGDGFLWYDPYTDSTQQPSSDLLPAGQEWKFGLRPGGPVFAPNADTPEWYADYQNGLNPTDWVDENGLPIEGIPEDFDGDGVQDLPEANAARLDYWGRTLADLGANRNGLLTDINGNVLGFNADLAGGVSRLESAVESTSSSQVHAIQAGTAAVQDGSANIVDAIDQNGQAVKQAIEEGLSEIEVDFGSESYAGYGDLIDLGAWANLDADIYQTGVDTNFGSASISPSIASSDYNIATGETSGEGNSFISGLGNGVAGAVETLLTGVTEFLDPFQAIGKVESLTVTIYGKPMVIDFAPFMAVINVIRAVAVVCVYFLAFCSVRSAVFMIFGGA